MPGQLHQRVGTPAFGLHQLPHCHGDRQLTDGQRRFGTEVPLPGPPPTHNSARIRPGEAGRRRSQVVSHSPPSTAVPFATAPTSARDPRRGPVPCCRPLKGLGFQPGPLGRPPRLRSPAAGRVGSRPPHGGLDPRGLRSRIPQSGRTGALRARRRVVRPPARKPTAPRPAAGELRGEPFLPHHKSPEPLPHSAGRGPPLLRSGPPISPAPDAAPAPPPGPARTRPGRRKTRNASSRPLGTRRSPSRAAPRRTTRRGTWCGLRGEGRGGRGGEPGAGLGLKGAVAAAQPTLPCGKLFVGAGPQGCGAA